jgi:hypothetical protein
MKQVTKKLLVMLPVGLLAFYPAVASAQLGNVNDLVTNLQYIINALIPLVAAIALLAFFYGLAKYIFQADDEEAKDQGKRIMIGGIIALFLIAAIGGIVEFIIDAFGLDGGAAIDPTNIKTNRN